jgi:hypothetical protein
VKLLRRTSKSGSTETVETDDVVEAVSVDPRRTPGKGRPTPKRRDSEVRRGPVAPPPKTRREAYRRLRERNTGRRQSVRQAMASGDDRYLTARDKGPVRALARDVVDSRRNMGSIFMFVAILVLVTYGLPASIRSFAMTLVLVIFVMVAVDSFALGRRIRKMVDERYPDEPSRGVAWYGIQRAMMIRRWRMPKARVKPGDPI